MRAVKINSKDRCIEEVEFDGLTSMQRHVGGLIEPIRIETPELKDHEVLVDEEGMCKDVAYGFLIKGGNQPYAGDGLVVGDTGEKYVGTEISKEEVEDLVEFIGYA